MQLNTILKVLNFAKILGFDMWYQSMVQTLGIDVAQITFRRTVEITY